MTARLSQLTSKLQELFPTGPPTGGFTNWGIPPLDVLDCVLSLNRRYDSFCLPRVQSFSERHPEIESLLDMLSLIRRYESPLEFSTRELDYRDEARAETLVGVLNYLLAAQRSIKGDSEAERLRQWAESVKPHDHVYAGVYGFGLAGFQYLRMLLGAQAAKPDVHIRRFVSDALGDKVGDAEALSLLEEGCAILKWRLSDLDYAVWQTLARSTASEDNWTYRLEVDGRTVTMPELPEAEALEQGRCLHAVLPTGTRIEYRCSQLNEDGRPYRSWPISKPHDTGGRATRGQKLASQYGLLVN
jgi:hypothetical protein